jgi:hypothetical protein
MDWRNLKYHTGQHIYACLREKFIDASMTILYHASTKQQRAHDSAMIDAWERLMDELRPLYATGTLVDWPPLTADMVLVDLFAECTGVCQFCAAIAVQFHPLDVNLSDLIDDTVPPGSLR